MYAPCASPTQSGRLGGGVPPKPAPKEWQRDQQVAEMQREVAQLREEMAQVAQAASITVVDESAPSAHQTHWRGRANHVLFRFCKPGLECLFRWIEHGVGELC